MKKLLFIFALSCSIVYSQDYKVEKDRIIDLFENLKKFGVNENQGNDRVAYSDFEIQARDYISKKVKYGWGGMINHEAYNNFELQRLFLEMNNFDKKKIHLFDYDKDEFPKIKFDIVTSLFSLDYHYDFNIYIDYLKKISTPKTKIIFDTIRADYFNGIFKNVKIISTNLDTVHKSNRIICSNFIN